MSESLENISVKDFFSKEVPKLFAEGVKAVDTSGLAGTEFTLQFNVIGASPASYCLKITDGKNLEVIEGGIDKPNLMIELSEENWREAITGKVPALMDQFMNPQQAMSRALLESAKNVAGQFQLELTRPGKPDYQIKMVFNGASSPQARLKMEMEDYVKMVRKQVDGPSLFMSGKMSFEGDMAFLLQLQGLIG